LKTRIFEAESIEDGLWGKFLVGVFDAEWSRRSSVRITDSFPTLRDGFDRLEAEEGQHPRQGPPLLWNLGWGKDHILVVDLSVGNGAIFRSGGAVLADVKKKAIYFCALFTDFLTWLYDQDLEQLDELPDKIVLPRPAATVRRTASQRPPWRRHRVLQ